MRWAVPDIHGCVKTFIDLLDKIKLADGDQLYLLGDYIDRGPSSQLLLDLIMELVDKGICFPICGNHDDWMLTLHDGGYRSDVFNSWGMNGGKETLKSFGVEKPEDIPKKYIDFLAALPVYIELDDYVLVHGGLNLYLKDPVRGTALSDMMWERPYGDETCSEWPLKGKKLVVGHTSRTKAQIKRYLELDKNVLMLDNGAVFKRQTEYGNGNLVAFNLDTKELIFVPCSDEVGYW